VLAEQENNQDNLMPAIELVQKYNTAGPRYTSYPTAVQFSPDVDLLRFKEDLRADADSEKPLSLYLHIPFCRDICYYCGCNKVVTRKAEACEAYLLALYKEIDRVSALVGRNRPVTQLHWGGGTPTYLTDLQTSEVMRKLKTSFNLINDDSREYSIEIDPRTVSVDRLALLWGMGFNRLSLGIQDFDEQVQKAVNRIQSVGMVEELVLGAREIGYESISFDLIYGLPHQSVTSYRETLERVIALAPDRISCYGYAHLPERFASQRAIDRLAVPSGETRLEIIRDISERLVEAGYRYIGMDHFVLPHDELAIAEEEGYLQRNFQGYSTHKADDLIGLGVSAISSLDGCYVQNYADLDDYYQAIADERDTWAKGVELSEDDKIRRSTIQTLSCQLALPFSKINDEFGIDSRAYFEEELARLVPMQDDGLLSIDHEGVTITPVGRYLIRNICMVFDAYLEGNTRFSKTI
jgi:oxygen-independent coproporphyrinogen-3 oxidase